VYGDRPAAAGRLASNVRRARSLRSRLALENDERLWTVPELTEATEGDVPIVFDILHWTANPRSRPLADELGAALRSWPVGRIPELHYSEQATGKVVGAHAEWVSGKELLAFARTVHEASEGRDVAVILEAKKKDLAIARAWSELGSGGRADLLRFFPDLARTPPRWWEDAKRFASAA
jgi:UV DNA damage endonuclease